MANDISINLNCYTIRFRKKFEKEGYLSVSDVFSSKGFQQIMKGFIKTIDVNCYRNEAKDRIMSLEKTMVLKDHIFTGTIRKGHSGHESYIEELNGNKAVQVGVVKTNQFNTSPFFFLVSLPQPGSDYFIFMAQSYRQFGFKEVFEEAFKVFLKNAVGEGIVCEFNTLAVASLFQKYVDNGNIRKLRLRKYGLIQQVEDVVRDKDYERNDYEVELSIKANRSKKNFLDYLRGLDLEETSFIELFDVDGFEFDEAFVDISIGNRKRVLNFTDPSKFAASFDVTREVPLNRNTKHPNFDKLNHEAQSILINEVIPYLR